MKSADKELLQTCIELMNYGVVTESYKEPMGSLMLGYAKALERGQNPKPPSLVPSPVLSPYSENSDHDSSEEQDGMISLTEAKACIQIVKTLDLKVRKFYNVFFAFAKNSYSEDKPLAIQKMKEKNVEETEKFVDKKLKLQKLANIIEKNYLLAGLSFAINK